MRLLLGHRVVTLKGAVGEGKREREKKKIKTRLARSKYTRGDEVHSPFPRQHAINDALKVNIMRSSLFHGRVGRISPRTLRVVELKKFDDERSFHDDKNVSLITITASEEGGGGGIYEEWQED